NGSRPDNGDLYHQVVKTFWLEPWQHRLLGTTFNLKNTNRVGMTDHLIYFCIVLWDVGQRKVKSIVMFSQIKCFSNTCKHTQSKNIDFKKAQCFDVVLVPLNTGTVLHTCIVYRTKIRQL